MAKRSGRSRGGVKGAMMTTLAVIVACSLGLAFLRVNNIHSPEDLWNWAQSTSEPTSRIVQSTDWDSMLQVCDFVSNASCLYQPNAKAKIGDVNGDGVIDNKDSQVYYTQAMQYAKNHGISTPHVDNNMLTHENALNDTAQSQGEQTQSQEQTQEQAQPVTDNRALWYDKLNSIPQKAGDNSSYKRSDYPHWIIQSGSCDTRETVLKNAGFNSNPRTCKAESKAGFEYTEPYSLKKVSNPSKLDIDHVIPLGYGNSHGGKAFSTEKKQQYANDIQDNLLAVDSSANRKKGDKGPKDWMPDNKGEWCSYSQKWITVALKYGFWLDSGDVAKLKEGIATCPAQ